MYWNPYVKRIFYNEDNNMITHKTLINSAFKKNDKWILRSTNDIEVFKITEVIKYNSTIKKTSC